MGLKILSPLATGVTAGDGPLETKVKMSGFELGFPPEEAAHVTEAYGRAEVILEYGSGGSTVLAAGMSGKLIFSVESDWRWGMRLQRHLDQANLASPAIVFTVDIGETGRWGRPVDEGNWKNFHRYPSAIWTEPYFRHPDVVLIDGRFRAACFAMTCLTISRPVTVLFDDYVPRPAYSVVERFSKPDRLIGRMAEFRLDPNDFDKSQASMFASFLTHTTVAAEDADYCAVMPI